MRGRVGLTPWHRDARTGQLLVDGEDPALFLHPAALIRNGAEPEVILAFVQESAAQVLDEVVNRWPTCQGAAGHWHRRLALRIDAVAQISQALRDRGLCTSSPFDKVTQDPVEQSLECIRLARDTASLLKVPLAKVVVEPRGRRSEGAPLTQSHAHLQTQLKQFGLQAGGFVEGLYLHGSGALGDNTGFSDLDGLVLLSTTHAH
jgi:hypothetical protein